MSSILKALKRLEEDKADRLDAPVDIGRDILRQPRRPRRSTTMPALPLAVAGSLIVAGVLFVLIVWKTSKAPDFAKKMEPVVAMPPSAPQLSVAAPPDRPVALHEPEVVEVRMTAPAPASANEPAVISTVPRPKRKAETTAVVKAPVLAPLAKPAASAVAQQEAARPNLAVTGIVFQSDRQARLAVVNDLPVMEGTVIEGARVEEIFADRVRFVWEDRTFEVELGEMQ
jgi:general secretion pathway protein B